MNIDPDALIQWIADTLTINGAPVRIWEWQREAIETFLSNDETVISVARSNGKSMLASAIAAAHIMPDSPLFIPNANVILVSGSYKQATILHRYIQEMMGARDLRRDQWRITNSNTDQSIQYRKTGARIVSIAQKPETALGIAAHCVICDEIAAWRDGSLYSAMVTSTGKVTPSRILSLSTRASDDTHWSAQLMAREISEGFGKVIHAAAPDDDYTAEATWRRANPSFDENEQLQRRLRIEARTAEADETLKAEFCHFRCNMGTPHFVENYVLHPDRYIEKTAPQPDDRPLAFGIDLSGGMALSALACIWRDGTIAGFAMTGNESIKQKDRKDGARGAYIQAHQQGHLLKSAEAVPTPLEILNEGIERYGMPLVCTFDRFRQREMYDALNRTGNIEGRPRGMGYKDGAADLRAFRNMALNGRIQFLPNSLMRYCFAGARTEFDPSGNEKLSKSTKSGRRRAHRDDLAAAAILATAELERLREAPRRATIIPIADQLWGI